MILIPHCVIELDKKEAKMIRKLALFCLFYSFLYAESCGSCDAVKDINKVVSKRQNVYDNQKQKILNLQSLNANYLLHLSGSNFELTRENKLINIYQQVYRGEK